jgi:hypothetical protein
MAHDAHYNQILREVTAPALSNDITYESDLKAYGRLLFGRRFRGVFMRDRVPSTITAERPYAIVNLDRNSEPGSHWIAVAHIGPRRLLVYDSYGAIHKVPRELLHAYDVEVTDPDAEQALDENNCGARVFAWLLVFDMFGKKEAALI